jgi:hypothetical protein
MDGMKAARSFDRAAFFMLSSRPLLRSFRASDSDRVN